MVRKKFQLYADYLGKLSLLSTEEMGILFRAILEDRNGKEIRFSSPVLKMAWAFIKDDLNAFDSMYEDVKAAKIRAANARWHDAHDADACK